MPTNVSRLFAAKLDSIEREPMGVSIARALQSFIASNHLQRGARLPSERALAEAMGISRPALREALKYLAAIDVLAIRQGAGIFVRQPQHPALTHLGQLGSRERLRMLRQATAARRLVDVAVAEAAARRGGLGSERLFAYIDESEREPNATLRRHQLDLGFEALIAELADDPYLSALQAHAHKLFQDAWSQCGLMPRPVEERNDQHRAIARAVASGRASDAREAMERHFALALLGGGDSRRGESEQ
jgi:GntR family transcriptional regulator, transcriptional repressor for pyruvate dehydrogenase complex